MLEKGKIENIKIPLKKFVYRYLRELRISLMILPRLGLDRLTGHLLGESLRWYSRTWWKTGLGIWDTGIKLLWWYPGIGLRRGHSGS